MWQRRAFALPKDDGYPSDDVLAASRNQHRYVLSDGASACYAGRAWARMLCRYFIRDADVRLGWLEKARKEFTGRVKPSPADWLGTMAFDRGSFATILGFTITPDEIVGIGIGDTVLFLQTPSDVFMYPQLAAEEFGQDPILISSDAEHDLFARRGLAVENYCFSMPTPDMGWRNCRLLAMTDALAAWVVALPDVGEVSERLNRLAAVEHKPDFSDLIRAEISAHRMRSDDTTLLILHQ